MSQIFQCVEVQCQVVYSFEGGGGHQRGSQGSLAGSSVDNEVLPSEEQKAVNSTLVDMPLLAAARNDIVALNTELAKAARNARLNKVKAEDLRAIILLSAQPSTNPALRSSGDLVLLQRDLAELHWQLADLQVLHSLTVDAAVAAREEPLTVEIKDLHGCQPSYQQNAGLPCCHQWCCTESGLLGNAQGSPLCQSATEWGGGQVSHSHQPPQTEVFAGWHVTLRTEVELDVICRADQAVQMANVKAGGRDPYDPDVVVAAKSALLRYGLATEPARTQRASGWT